MGIRDWEKIWVLGVTIDPKGILDPIPSSSHIVTFFAISINEVKK